MRGLCSGRRLRLTPFDADDGSPEAQRDSEALPDVDHPVEETVVCVQVWNHTLLLLQGLQKQANVCERAKAKNSKAKALNTKKLTLKRR